MQYFNRFCSSKSPCYLRVDWIFLELLYGPLELPVQYAYVDAPSGGN
jgi:formylmethanofuran dehydrogenase subunit E-like metal-binding protein